VELPKPNVTHVLPTDEALLAAVGQLTLRHGQLDNQLRMAVMALTGVTKEEALNATLRDGSRVLRDRVVKLAKYRLGDGPALVRLQSLVARAAGLADKRNELVHSVWGTEKSDGSTMIRGDDNAFRPAPTVSELQEWERQLTDLVVELATARERGFLAAALAKKPLKS
jgi:hypothetical protein